MPGSKTTTTQPKAKAVVSGVYEHNFEHSDPDRRCGGPTDVSFQLKPGKRPDEAQTKVVQRGFVLLTSLETHVADEEARNDFGKRIIGAVEVGAVNDAVSPDIAHRELDRLEQAFCSRLLQGEVDRVHGDAAFWMAAATLAAVLIAIGLVVLYDPEPVPGRNSAAATLISIGWLLLGMQIGRFMMLVLERRKRIATVSAFETARHVFRKPFWDMWFDVAIAIAAALFFATGLVEISVADVLSTKDVNTWLVGCSVGVLIGFVRLAFVKRMQSVAQTALPETPPVAGA